MAVGATSIYCLNHSTGRIVKQWKARMSLVDKGYYFITTAIGSAFDVICARDVAYIAERDLVAIDLTTQKEIMRCNVNGSAVLLLAFVIFDNN